MIAILLATYNGENYIKQQLDSLMNQTVQDFHVYAADDRSSDATWKILTDYAERFPDRITITQNEKNSGGSRYNFLNLMIRCKEDYVMLCDQDDVWLPQKIEKTMRKMKRMEKQYGKECPLLVYTDLTVVDSDLSPIAESMMVRANADFTKTSLRDQLVQNTATGCTILYNRAAAELLQEMPAYTVMHDWWVMLTVCALGHAEVLPEPTILYRQHSDNSIGSRDMHNFRWMLQFFLKGSGIRTALRETYDQADALLRMYGTRMTPEKRKLTAGYAGLRTKSKPQRILTLLRLKTLKQGTLRKLAQMIYC